jgi:hypothetical protein
MARKPLLHADGLFVLLLQSGLIALARQMQPGTRRTAVDCVQWNWEMPVWTSGR